MFKVLHARLVIAATLAMAAVWPGDAKAQFIYRSQASTYTYQYYYSQPYYNWYWYNTNTFYIQPYYYSPYRGYIPINR